MTQIKEIPILFSTPMVQAILEGRKTMTRRVVKHSVNNYPNEWRYQLYGGMAIGPHADRKHQFIGGAGCYSDVKCTYGKPGDVLWVREKFIKAKSIVNGIVKEYHYATDGTTFGDYEITRWTPSIHMPKSAARIWLEVTDIRVERLHDISNEDIRAEGIQFYQNEAGRYRYRDYMADVSGYGHPDHDFPEVGVALTSFCSLWEKINGIESWEANPWVWVVSFKVLSTTGKPLTGTELNYQP